MKSDKKYCENCGIEIHPEDILCSDCFEIEMEYLSEVEEEKNYINHMEGIHA